MSNLNPNPPFKIFVSSPDDYWLNADQQAFKHKIIEKLQADGFEVEIMGEMGMSFTQEKIWSLERAERIIQCCQGIVVIGLARWHKAEVWANGQSNQIDHIANVITEFSHTEGALAFAHKLPMLLLNEDGVRNRGVLHPSHTIVSIPEVGAASFIDTDPKFKQAYSLWSSRVKERFHVFFGYSGGADQPALKLINFLRQRNVKVLDWHDFPTVGSVLNAIESAGKKCLGGIFLFTGDDTIESTSIWTKVPRDNVIFETGYFINAKGENRVQIILEKGTKVLADLGGKIYIELEDRNKTSAIETKLLDFVEQQLSKIDN